MPAPCWKRPVLGLGGMTVVMTWTPLLSGCAQQSRWNRFLSWKVFERFLLHRVVTRLKERTYLVGLAFRIYHIVGAVMLWFLANLLALTGWS